MKLRYTTLLAKSVETQVWTIKVLELTFVTKWRQQKRKVVAYLTDGSPPESSFIGLHIRNRTYITVILLCYSGMQCTLHTTHNNSQLIILIVKARKTRFVQKSLNIIANLSRTN